MLKRPPASRSRKKPVMTTILVAGSTGTIGSRLVTALATRPNVTVRAGTRDPGSKKPVSSNVEYVAYDLTKPETLGSALRGVDKVFNLMPLDPRHDQQAAALVEASKAAGLKQIVELSTSVIDGTPVQFGRWHRHSEQLVEQSGIAYTLLRPTLFMSDFAIYWAPAPDGNIYLPFGSGRVPYIDPLDIAEVAAAALTDERHHGKTYVLTGGEALTVAQIASRIGEATGRSINYVDVPPEAARAAMAQAGMPAWMVDGMLEMFATVKAGEGANVTTTVRQVLGREPRSFSQFARDNAAAFKR